jgi:hypothetical protein
MGAVADSNLDFSAAEGGGNGCHGVLRLATLPSSERKLRNERLADAVLGSQRAM